MNWINRHNPFFVFIEWWDEDTGKWRLSRIIFWKYWVLRLINAQILTWRKQNGHLNEMSPIRRSTSKYTY